MLKNKIVKRFYQLNLYVFSLFWLAAFLISLVESISYSGFSEKNIHISFEIIFCLVILSSFLVIFIPVKKIRYFKWSILPKKLLFLNIVIFSAMSSFALLTKALEDLHYPNYVYSKFHLRPDLLYKPVFLIGFLLFVSLCIFIWEKHLDGEISKMSVRFLHKESRFQYPIIVNFIYLTYAIALFAFVVGNSVNFSKKFYKVDKDFRQENELRYALRRISIYQWIGEYLPLTKNVVFWCDKQEQPVGLVSLDPQIIWNNYEGLSRVFLTNCHYVNFNFISETNKYLEKDNLLLVSITPCDSKLKGHSADSNENIMEYFKIINNEYICNSSEVLPGLYLYKGVK